MFTLDKDPLDLNTVNIFDNPIHLKIWGHMLSKACGSNLNNVKADTVKINKLTKKFIQDYNNKKELNEQNTYRNKS